MMRFLIYVILFYILWKLISIVVKSLITSKSKNPDLKNGKDVRSKYKNIEDAKYIEIKDEDKDKENKQ